MRKVILSSAALLFFISSFAQQKGEVVIKGTMNGDLKGYNTIYMYTRMGTDSAEVENGHYSFRFPFAGTEMKMFYPQYTREMHSMYRPFGVLISEPGTYYIVSDIARGMYGSEVKGPEAAVLYRQFGADQDEAYKKINGSLAKLYGDTWYQHIEDADVKKSQDSLQQVYLVPVIEKLVKEHPNSAAAPFVLAGAGRTVLNINEQEKMYGLLSDKMKHTDEGMKFHHYIQGVKNSAIGKKVADFTLPDPQGKPVDFNSFKGKYVLIDFWASWCVPCRQSFPKMRKIYQQYKDKGFEIYSISIDENKPNWLKAVGEENNPWPQSLDTRDMASKGFAVTAVPTSYLVDPQGKIIAKQVGFDDKEEGPVEEKLASLFGPVKADGGEAVPQHKKVIKAMKMTPMQ